MAKAHLITKTGTKILIEGAPNEVACIISSIKSLETISRTKIEKLKSHASKHKMPTATPTNLVSSLIDGDFFIKDKDITQVKEAIAAMGHHYPITALSPVLLRLVRKGQLRRTKDKNKWLYLICS